MFRGQGLGQIYYPVASPRVVRVCHAYAAAKELLQIAHQIQGLEFLQEIGALQGLHFLRLDFLNECPTVFSLIHERTMYVPGHR